MTQLPLTTTLNRILAAGPCREGAERGLRAAGKSRPDDEPVTYGDILEAVGLDDAIWCCRAEPSYDCYWEIFAVWCSEWAQKVVDVAEEQFTKEDATAVEKLAHFDSHIYRDRVKVVITRLSYRPPWYVLLFVVHASSFVYAHSSIASRSLSPDQGWYSAYLAARKVQADAFRQLVTTGTLPSLP